jgi:hypothetical protein
MFACGVHSVVDMCNEMAPAGGVDRGFRSLAWPRITPIYRHLRHDSRGALPNQPEVNFRFLDSGFVLRNVLLPRLHSCERLR